ncbi:MAG TPA: hypothetical protein VG015_00145, partial [Candidatus Dormibacteraeota bacterium]|nr:hypothetical protein [Candidatus Dormibacteraeota bacterium]
MQTDSSASWDQSLTALAAPPPLLQSWGWGEIQARSGWKVDRITLPGGGRCTVLRQRVGPWTWAYVPRGPVPATEAALVDLLDWAKHQRLTRLRIEPERGPDFRQVLERLGLRPASSVQPQHTLILNLRPEEQMLARFRANHRHSLRTADRREVEVVEGAEIAVIDDLARSTATRQQIHLPGGGY